MGKMNFLDYIAIILLIIGGLNWGLSVFSYNLVSALLGTGLWAKIVYGLVGLSALYSIYSFIKLAVK